jgi:hypothetical protein
MWSKREYLAFHEEYLKAELRLEQNRLLRYNHGAVKSV